MKTPKRLKRKRPGVLVRFYPTDLAALNKHCADACTPRENFIRRCVLQHLAMHQEHERITATIASNNRQSPGPAADVVELVPGTGLAGGLLVKSTKRRSAVDKPKKKR